MVVNRIVCTYYRISSTVVLITGKIRKRKVSGTGPRWIIRSIADNEFRHGRTLFVPPTWHGRETRERVASVGVWWYQATLLLSCILRLIPLCSFNRMRHRKPNAWLTGRPADAPNLSYGQFVLFYSFIALANWCTLPTRLMLRASLLCIRRVPEKGKTFDEALFLQQQFHNFGFALAAPTIVRTFALVDKKPFSIDSSSCGAWNTWNLVRCFRSSWKIEMIGYESLIMVCAYE